MERFNEWWFSGRIRKDLALPFKRHDFPRVMESLKGRQILLVTGLRRVGKTTLMYQAIEKLLETVDPDKILYFSFDESAVACMHASRKSLAVPPYMQSVEITWSFFLTADMTAAVIAAIPDAHARASSPFSNAATFFSNARVVGFPRRV